MKGYQFLENDFFSLCRTRKIGRIPLLLLVYLRGLYCYFRKPVFGWRDKEIMQDLGISRSTLLRAREYLQTRGVIKFQSGKGNRATEYTMIGSVLLPVLKTSRQYPSFRADRSRQNDDSLPLSIKEILLKNQVNGKNFNFGK